MKILVTRPTADAAAVSRALEERGATILAEPLLSIEPRPAELPDLDDAQALLFTSANGVRAFAARTTRRDLPVHAVGDATAEAAREAGFGDVDSAAGDVAALAAAVISIRKPDAGPLIQVAGTVSAGDLAGDLSRAGFRVERVVLYEAVPATRLGEALTAALAAGEVAGALFFSPRTARLFLDLVDQAGRKAQLGSVTAYALSPAVAEILGAGDFRRTVTADAPTLTALLAAFDRDPPTPAQAPSGEGRVEVPAPVVIEPVPAASRSDVPRDDPPSARPLPDRPAPISMPLPPPAAPARSGGAAGWLGLLLLLVVAGVGTTPWWGPAVLPLLPWGAAPPTATADDAPGLLGRITALEGTSAPLPAKLDALDRRVSALQARLDQGSAGAPAPAAARVVDLSAPLDALAQRLGKLEQAAASLAPVSGRLEAVDARLRPVEQRLGSLEQSSRAEDPKLALLASRVDALAGQVASLATRSAAAQQESLAAARSRLVDAVVPAATAIRAAVETGQAFAGPLAIVARDKGMGPLAAAAPAIDPALAVLTPAAARGVDALPQLRADFPAAAAAIRSAARAGEAAVPRTGWWDQARETLGGMVRVSRTDAEAPGAEGVIARAGQALAQNDLGGAAAALHGLSGAAAAAAAPWLHRADGRLAALSAADSLVAALGSVALGPAPAPPTSSPAAPAP